VAYSGKNKAEPPGFFYLSYWPGKKREQYGTVADALAKLARSAGSCIWTSSLPDLVYDLVTQDITETEISKEL
jgi:hypothetical protein